MLKIALYSIILTFLVFMAVYTYFKVTMFDDLRVSLSRQLSSSLSQPVKIGSMDFVPFQTFSFRDISVYEDKRCVNKLYTIDSIDITVDFFSAIFKKELFATIDLYDMRLDKNIIINALFRTKSTPAKSYRELFSPKLVDSVSLIASDLDLRGIHVKNITGEIRLHELGTTTGKVRFNYQNKGYLLLYEQIAGGDIAYRIALSSREMNVKGNFYKTGDDMAFRQFSGKIGTTLFDVEGEIKNFMSPLNKQGYIAGSLETDIKDLASFPIDKKLSDHIIQNKVGGHLSVTDMNFEFNGPEIDAAKFAGSVAISDLTFKDKHIEKISSVISLSGDRFSFSEIAAVLYGGSLSGKAVLGKDPHGKVYLSSLDASVKKFDIETILGVFNAPQKNIKGTIHLDVSLRRKSEDLNPLAADHSLDQDLLRELSKYNGRSKVVLTDFSCGNLKNVDELSAKISVNDNIISMSEMNAFLYNGSISGNLVIKLTNSFIPYLSSAESEISALDLNAIIRDLKWNNDVLFGGIISTTISLKRPEKEGADGSEYKFSMNLFKELTKYSGSLKFSLEDPEFKHIKNINSLSATMTLSGKKQINLSEINASLNKGLLLGNISLGLTRDFTPYLSELYVNVKNMDMPTLLETFNLKKDQASGDIQTMALALKRNPNMKVDPQDLSFARNLYEELTKYTGTASFAIKDPGFKGLALTHIDSFSTKLDIARDRFRFSQINSSLYGGTLSGQMELRLDETYTPYVHSINGMVDGIDIATFLRDLNGDKAGVFGIFSANLSLERRTKKHAEKTKTPIFKELSNYNGSGLCMLYKPGVKNIRIDDLKVKFSMKNGMFTSKGIEGNVYGGKFSGDFMVDLNEQNLPYDLSYSIKGIDYSRLVTDINQKGNNIYGTLDSELFITGNANNLATMEGTGKIFIKDANLGPMPIISPLVGNVYTLLQTIFAPGDRAIIKSASAKFHIRDKKVITDEAAMWSDVVYMTIDGSVGFDGSVNLAFQNDLVEEEEEEQQDWQTALRNFAIRFGKTVGKAHLTGTIKDPVWTFSNS